MGTEIERKFLVIDFSWKNLVSGVRCSQGYLCLEPEKTVRVRTAGSRGYLTIKGRGSGIARPEYEYEVPHADAVELLENLCEKPLIEKKRYTIEIEGLLWEVDEFYKDNEGLVIAEVELEHRDQEVVLPAWVGKEVSGDFRYYNASLVRNPWKSWKD